MKVEVDDRHYWTRLRETYKKYYLTGNMWDGARFILADVPLDAKAVGRVLPFGMKSVDPAVGTVFIADYPKTSFDVIYKEAALLIHVRTPLGRGVHCTWMVVDDDTAMIYGREGLGYPKKMARFEFKEEGDHVFAGITRRGVNVLRMEGARGQAQTNPEPVFARKTFNVGGPGQWLSINPIWLFRPTEVIHESIQMGVTVIIEDSECDPISELVSGPPMNGRFVVMDIPGSKYMLPVGLAGLKFFANTASIRSR
jgi:acetoacetate decarboxylase